VKFKLFSPVYLFLSGKEDEQLIWLENPSGDYSTTWNAHVLAHGPGVYFRFAQMNTPEGPKESIFTAQFFTSSLSVYWTTQTNGLYTDSSKVLVYIHAVTSCKLYREY
jgi:hypothetical protein